MLDGVPRAVRHPIPVVTACLAVIAFLGILVRGENAVTRLDADVVAELADARTGPVVDVARAVTTLGDGLVLGGLLLAAGLVLAATRSTRPWAAFAPALALGLASGLNVLQGPLRPAPSAGPPARGRRDLERVPVRALGPVRRGLARAGVARSIRRGARGARAVGARRALPPTAAVARRPRGRGRRPRRREPRRAERARADRRAGGVAVRSRLRARRRPPLHG